MMAVPAQPELTAEADGCTSYGRRDRQVAAKIPALTGIRGYAALWVVLFHFQFGLLPADVPILRSGYLGVDLFFIVSGFVLTMTYAEKFARPTVDMVRAFIASRFFRIVPLNSAVLLAFLLIAPFMNGYWHTPESHSVTNFLLALFLVQAWFLHPAVWNTPAWSLSCEWLAYLCFPALIVAVRKIRYARLAEALALISLTVLGATMFALAGPRAGLNHVHGGGLIRCAGGFTAGMLLCRMTQIETVGSRAGVVSLACGLIVLAPAFTGARFEYVAPIGFSLIVLSCASQAKLPAMIFGNSVTVFLGEISFSIYLLHWWLLELAQRVARLAAPNDANMLAACFSATVLLIVPLSFLSWRFIELPAQAFGKAYLRSMQDKRAAKPSNENAQGSPLATAL